MGFGVENLSSQKLKDALACYEDKIPRVLFRLNVLIVNPDLDISLLKPYVGVDIYEEISNLQKKIARLRAKKQAVLDELAKREITGEPIGVHGTTYYIDYVNGSDANNGLSPSTAWKTIPQYTSNTVRSAGDIAYVRRNQTHTYNTADIVCDEDGTPNNFIVLKGDDGTGWPGEAGLPKPIISFGDANYQFLISGDDYWRVEDFQIQDTIDVEGCIKFDSCKAGRLIKCDCHDGNAANCRGLNVTRVGFMEVEECTFYNIAGSGSAGVYVKGSWVIIRKCTFNGGPDTTDYGLKTESENGIIEIYDSSFGQTTAHDLNDITLGGPYQLRVLLRNVKLQNETIPINGPGGIVKSEDHDSTKLENKQWLFNGMIYRDTTIVRSGGADSSARVEPNSNCGSDQKIRMFEFPIWAPASQKTYSIYLRGSGWSSFPTASELWIEAEYFSDAADSDRSITKSTQVLTANDAWTEFNVTVTPVAAGPIYLRGYLAKYQANAKIYVDIKPVVS